MNKFIGVKIFCMIAFLQFIYLHSNADTADYFLLESKGNKSFNFLILTNLFTYNDINLDSAPSSDSFVYAQSQGISLGIRSNQIYMFSLVYRQNSENQRKTTGMAFRSYLPGFYLIGGSVQNLIIDFSQRRFHTYWEAELDLTTIVDQTTQLTSKYYENSIRIGLEITLLSGLFIDASYGLATYKSNNTWVTGVGLGVRF